MDIVNQYSEHVKRAFDMAEGGISNISQDIIDLDGMSGTKTRHFYNNLLSMNDSRYLEVGTWKGSTVCSAMYGNKANVTCIDNWSYDESPKQIFLSNFNRFKGENNAHFIESDCFTTDRTKLGKYNIYLYDGDHLRESHYKSLTYFYTSLDDTFIFVVDDWNDERVRLGTKDAIRDLNLKVCFEKEIRLTHDNSHTPVELGKKTWWNGIYAAVLQK